jgi:alpha-L-rhamnosidase
MIIKRMKTNRVTNPLGFNLEAPRFSWVTEDTTGKAHSQAAAQVQVAADAAFAHILYDSGRRVDIDSLAFRLPLALEPCTRYFWRVTVWADDGEKVTSEVAWFETAKMGQPWQAEWVTPDWEDKKVHPLLRKEFILPAKAVSARAYVCGLGLYELEINGKRVGDERLTPGYNAYDHWIQYQTYDITALLQSGANVVGAMLGNGWYKGRFSFEGFKDSIYGDRFALLCELEITCEDGSTVVIGTDTTWKAAPGPVVESSIYDGEIYDANRQVAGWSSPGLDLAGWAGVRPIDIGLEQLEPRRGLPVKIMEERKPAAVIHTPAGETVLDLGQNMVGWMRMKVNAPKGTEIFLQFGEILQNGNFFRDNLRSAKAEYHYISDGKPVVVEPHFTYYGFRFVKLTRWYGEVNPDDFTGCVVYSELEQTGSIETSNPMVNRLFLNALWGQKGNFLDVPTDCPQRDERMGWTGDAQVFSGTALYNMDVAAFFGKYTYDMMREQRTRGGMVPMVVPANKMSGGGSSAWGDAATIIPWNVYLHTGDKAILEQRLESMKGWVDWIRENDEKSGGKRLWTTGFHFGDWLALDGDDPRTPLGGTPEDFIASAYYYYSASLVAKAAEVIGRNDLAQEYGKLAEEIRTAIRAEYFTPWGRIAINTQTAMVLGLFMDLVPPEHRQRLENTLRERLKKDKYHLKTGFVGTPYLCRVLSDNHNHDMAFRLFLNEDYPSWLYAVKLGATTIWERWNSLLPDGTISDLTMNSFNHYSYGSIMEWVYRNVAGLRPLEEAPGFRRVRLAPQPDSRLKWIKVGLESAAGRYESEWAIQEDGKLAFHFRVPFNASALLVLPDARLEDVSVSGAPLGQSGLFVRQDGAAVSIELPAGAWDFVYMPTKSYLRQLSTYSPMEELLKYPQAIEIIKQTFPQVVDATPEVMGRMLYAAPRDLLNTPFVRITAEMLDQLDIELAKIKL